MSHHRSVGIVAGLVVAIVMLAVLPGTSAAVGVAEANEPISSTEMTFDDVAALDELTSDHSDVFRLYWAFFDRVPDAGGALYWIDQFERCVSLRSIAQSFEKSLEFEATYGNLDDDSFLDVVYANVLDRRPDAIGRAYWSDLIDRGTLERVDVLLNFSLGEEFSRARPFDSDVVPHRGCLRGGTSKDRPRSFVVQPWPVYATVADVALRLPSAAVEMVGFHQSTEDGAQPQIAVPTAAPAVTMDSRRRGTARLGAADIAAHPLVEVRSPVTGTVLRAGRYALYCRYADDFVIVEPDGHPGWEVKILHIRDLHVSPGDRVEAGVTVIADRPNQLPFASQIDRLTGQPAWPHVHVEVIDTAIVDRPATGGGC